MNNQDYVLAQWRKDGSKNDPPFYSAQTICGRKCVWMSINNNIGWYEPVIRDGAVVAVRALGLPPPDELETAEEQKARNSSVSPKQAKKLWAIVQEGVA